MSALPKRFEVLSRDEYLTREYAAESRSEFFDGEVVAMAGATITHVAIVANLITTLSNQLRDGPCRVFNNDLRVSIASGRRYVYPDVLVICGAAEFEVGTQNTVTNPVVIIEVLSTSTVSIDRGLKFHAYQALSSLREYVLISIRMRRIEVYRRDDQGGWRYESCPFLPSPIRLHSISCVLDLDEVYFRAEVPEEATEEYLGSTRPPEDETLDVADSDS